jgi:hypothetical protein
MDPIILSSLIQGGAGLAQTILGAGQRKRAERNAQKQIGRLGPDKGILSYYNQALQRAGVSPTQSALYKRQMQNIQRAGATGLAGARGTAARMGAASSIARSLSDATLGAEVAAEGQQERRFAQVLPAAQLAAAEKRRPEELRLQMMLQKAAGGSDIANTGLSNLFGALQSYGTNQLYKEIYGLGGTGRSGGGRVSKAGLGSMDRTPLASGLSTTTSGLRPSATPSLTRGVSMMPSPVRTPYIPPYTQALNPVNYPF